MLKNSQISLNINKMPNFQQWKKSNNGDFSIFDYLGAVGNMELVIALTKLFYPDVVEHEGGIFLAETFQPEIYEQWKAQLENMNEIERVMNHLHLDDLFSDVEEVGIENLYYLGQTLQKMWELRLQSLYPQQEFKVLCNLDTEAETVVLTFSSVRFLSSSLRFATASP